MVNNIFNFVVFSFFVRYLDGARFLWFTDRELVGVVGGVGFDQFDVEDGVYLHRWW